MRISPKELTRLSGKVAPALKGTEQVGVTSGGLVKAQTWFPPPLWKPGGGSSCTV